ncbi:MAG: hypothetical protein J6Y37_03960 [Paludibacteraceae bacterium]|nr:hypothetical protein [Paludibacteraceae bacterium]
MRHFKLCLMAFLLLLCGCKNKPANDWESMGLNGKVKQIIEQQFLTEIRFGKVEKGDLYRSEGWDCIYYFNEKGRFSKVSQLDAMSDELSYTTYTYNQHDTLTIETSYDAEGEISEKSVYTYDEKGRVAQVVIFNNTDNLTGSRLYEYDDKTNTSTICAYSPRGRLLNKAENKLDRNGNPAEFKLYNEENQLVNYRKEVHAKDGQLKMLTILTPSAQIVMTVTFQYDKNGNLLLQEGSDENGERFIPKRYEYKFDEKGNWTQKIEYEGDEAKTVTERQIEYYE